MRRELDELMEAYRRGGLSRRQLAAGLTAATASLATAGVLEGAGGGQPAIGGPALPAAVFVPPAAGGGADDFQAIQDSIDAAAAAGGGQVSITEPLSVGATLTMKTGVELVGAGLTGSSITALPSFSGDSLIEVEADASNAAFYGLTLDAAGVCQDAVLEIGAGCSWIRIAGVRLTGWGAATPEVAGVRLDEPPDPGGSNTPIRHVEIDDCDLDQLGRGLEIGGGASHLAVRGCRFRGMHRNGLRLRGGPQLSSGYLDVTGNLMLDFPLESGLDDPIALGAAGDAPHEHLHVSRNVIIGNGGFHGGGSGAGDQISLRWVNHAQVVCNAVVDGGAAGIAVVDSNDVVLLGNAAITSELAGFVIEGRDTRCLRIQLLGNYARNNGQNRAGAALDPWLASGFLLHDQGDGVVDAHLVGNYSWDTQAQKTQNYALAIADDTIHSTRLTGNSWRAALHAIDAVYNRGRRTERAIYEDVPQLP